LPIFIVQKN